MHKETSEKNWK